ncbi:MAG: hypothetical protein V8Q21_03840 [Akkermansia muciniphila]
MQENDKEYTLTDAVDKIENICKELQEYIHTYQHENKLDSKDILQYNQIFNFVRTYIQGNKVISLSIPLYVQLCERLRHCGIHFQEKAKIYSNLRVSQEVLIILMTAFLTDAWKVKYSQNSSKFSPISDLKDFEHYEKLCKLHKIDSSNFLYLLK